MRNRNAGLIVTLLLLAASSTMAQSFTWQSQAALPTGGAARAYGSAVFDGTDIFLLGGTPWTSGGDGVAHRSNGGAFSVTTSLEGSFVHVRAAIDSLNRIIIVGGVDSSGDEGDAYEWTVLDGNNGGIEARSESAPSALFALATDPAGYVYSLGGGPGANPTAQDPNSTRVERYDAATDTWTVMAPMPAAAADGAACHDGLGHIVVIRARLAAETVSHYGDNGLPDESAACLAAAAEAGPVPFEPPYQYRGRMRDVTTWMREQGLLPPAAE